MKRGTALAIALAALVAALVATPGAAGDLVLHGRIGDVFVGIDTRDDLRHRRLHRPLVRPHQAKPRTREPMLFRSGPVNDFARDQKRAAQEQRQSRPQRRVRRPHFGRHPHAVPYVFGYGAAPGAVETYQDNAPAEAAPAPEPPVQEPPAVEQPPDARGPLWETARGRGGAQDSYAVGQPLPRGVPHVTLDWRDYDLPRPPAGQVYARVGAAVLLIDADSRMVRRVLWPNEDG